MCLEDTSADCRLWVWEEGGKEGVWDHVLLRNAAGLVSGWRGLCVKRILGFNLILRIDLANHSVGQPYPRCGRLPGGRLTASFGGSLSSDVQSRSKSFRCARSIRNGSDVLEFWVICNHAASGIENRNGQLRQCMEAGRLAPLQNVYARYPRGCGWRGILGAALFVYIACIALGR
jgi:hypothetical protein